MIQRIQYYEEDISARLPDEESLTAWLDAVAAAHGSEIASINYIFCSDDYLLEINREHLNHDYYTDIITFPYREGEVLESDIFISVERVEDNAAQYGVAYERELLRVMAHGVLHLIGFGDKTEAEAAEMRQREDDAVSLYGEEE